MHLTNVRFNPRDRYFLDSRATALEGLALIPIQTNSELGSSLPQVVAELSATDFYPPLFGAAFGYSGVTEDGIARALAQFMRSFISYRAPFDRAHYSTTSPWSHDQPDPSLVLTPQELRGRDLFIAKQCFHCHMAASFASPWPDNNGLDSVTTDPIDGRFRVGSLRNIAVTGPYMHDGRFATLREVIDHYNSGIQPHPELAGPLGGSGTPFRMNFTEDDKLALEAFFHTLTDQEFLNDPKFSDPFAR
jgi:cytochrome c peroxidase